MGDKADSPASFSLDGGISQQSSVTAQNSGVANVPQIIGCNTQGSVNISIETHIHTAANANETHGQSSMEACNIVCNLSKKVSDKLKSNLKLKFKNMYEGHAKRGNPSVLRDIYTELYITEGEMEGLNMEHEIWQIDKTVNPQPEQDNQISCNDIFKPFIKKQHNSKSEKTSSNTPEKCEKTEATQPRTVLTKGIAGIGKTVTVQKFILDWAEGKANQDIDLLFVLPFRELNSVKDEQSLHQLLIDFHSELQEFRDTKYCEDCKMLFIFDGLDESQLSLDFHWSSRVSSVSKPASLDVLMTNLISGNLLPSAFVWITSRPAAIDRIPQDQIQRMTEIRGFTDLQKEEYFRKRIRDQTLADRVISHVKESRSLEIMCHIPIFCWITSTVLELMLKESNTKILLSLAEMYTRFLLIQTNEKKKKYDKVTQSNPLLLSKADIPVILDLGKLAFEKLQKSDIVFSVDDLKEYNLDVTEASLWSGVFTEIIKIEDPVFSEKKYSFVHLSFQEYLAAFFVFYKYAVEKENILQLSRRAPPRRFLFEDDYDSEYYFEPEEDQDQDQTLFDLQKCAIDKALNSKSGNLDLFLRFLLGLSMKSSQKLLKHILVNVEIEQRSITRTIQYLKDKLREEDDRKTPSSERCINLFQCLLELEDSSMAEEIRRFLNSNRPAGYKLTAAQCSTLAYIILMSGQVLDELDLKKYSTSEEGQRRLVPAARNCKKALLSGCQLDVRCCEALASALQDPGSHLEELDLSCQGLFDTPLTSLHAGLNSPHCRLATLDLSHMNLERKGALVLHAVLMGPHSQPQILRLIACNFSDDCAEILASALWSADCQLRELDISYNSLTSAGLNNVLQGLLSPSCYLQILRLSGSKISADSCLYLASALRDAYLKELILDNSSIGNGGVKRLCCGLVSPHCQLQTLGLKNCQLSRNACFYLTVALCTHSVIKSLNLGDNDLQDSGVEFLSAGLKNPNCLLQSLGLSGCMVTGEGCSTLASALRTNCSHLKELDLSFNHPGNSGAKKLTARLEDPHCRLKILKLDHGGRSRITAGLWKYYQEITMDCASSKLDFCGDRRAVIRFPEYLLFYDSDDEEKDNSTKWENVCCREGLEQERFYWEVEWTGFVSIGVKYRGIFLAKCLQLVCHEQQCVAMYKDQGRTKAMFIVAVPEKRIGVFLDWPAGTLSFYSISPQGTSRVYTFHTTFEKPVYPHFSFAPPDMRDRFGSVVIATQDPDSVRQSKFQMRQKELDFSKWYGPSGAPPGYNVWM